VDDLFDLPNNPRPFKVELKGVHSPVDQYMVRWWLLDTGWEEYQDWIIAGRSLQTGVFEVWFKELGKAMLFKLSFTL
jgi:hypothetical protein